MKAKSFSISKHAVWEAYKKVNANNGCAGVDKQTLQDFNLDLKNNLYKLWNRLSSGCYFPPPVRRVEIPKTNGKTRPLGIPTVTDRIAQMVVKDYLEPIVDPSFHEDSYGYRPGKSAIDAVEQTRQRCWRDDWVLDLDIKGFFDSLDHKLVMKAVRKFTKEAWVLLYIQRWLQAEVQLLNGERVQRTLGTPQGGVISPLLANMFLHFVFDQWMRIKFPCVHFERYADDIVIHCRSLKQLELVRSRIWDRFKQCGLELCNEKTKIVYCKDSNRIEQFPEQNFDFLGFTFRPRSCRDSAGSFFVSFSPAVSQKSLKAMRSRIKENPLIKGCFSLNIEELACNINPIIRGWINYYGKFGRSSMKAIYWYINDKLTKWVQRKYKNLCRRKKRAGQWLRNLCKQHPDMFAHWQVWNWVSE